MGKEKPRCVNDIWEGRIPTCNADFLSCNPDVCEFYHPVNDQGQPQVRTVKQLLDLLEKYQLEIYGYFARPSKAYILTFFKKTAKEEICKTAIPIETVNDIKCADHLIEKAILDAIKALEKKEEHHD